MTTYHVLIAVILMILGIGTVVIGVSLVRIEKILKARGLASPHVIVSTGEGGVMKGMHLDISGPGYSEDTILDVKSGQCTVTGCIFSHGMKIATGKPKADPVYGGCVRKGGEYPPPPSETVDDVDALVKKWEKMLPTDVPPYLDLDDTRRRIAMMLERKLPETAKALEEKA